MRVSTAGGVAGGVREVDDTFYNPREPGSAEDRYAVRESLFLGTEIDCASGVETGRIRNLSATGAFVELARSVPIGEHLLLTFRRFDHVEAVVVRITAKGFGVRFASPIDPAICRRTVSARPQDLAKEYVLCQLEGNRRARWDNAPTGKGSGVSRS